MVFLYWSAAQCGGSGDREVTVMAVGPVHDSAVSPCLLRCPASLERHSLLQSSPSCSCRPSPCSQQGVNSLALRLLPKPCAPAPSHHAPWRICVPVQVTLDCGTDRLCSSPSLQTAIDQLLHLQQHQMPPICPELLLWWGDPSPALQSHLLSFSFSLPSSYQVLRGSIYPFPVVRDSCQLSAGTLWDTLFKHKFMSYKLFFQKFFVLIWY